MAFSILSTLAYCITWWAGYVRDYWLVLTIVELLIAFINVSVSSLHFSPMASGMAHEMSD